LVDGGIHVLGGTAWLWSGNKAAGSVDTLIIDEAGQVTESNKANNARAVTLPAPDLLIDSITLSPESPVELVPVSFTATVRNRGFGQAAGTQAACYIDGAALAPLDTGEISAAGTATVFFTYAFAPGEHSIRLAADGGDTLAESSESNNEKIIKFSVQSRVKSASANTTPSANNTAPKPPAPAAAVPVKASENVTGQMKTAAPKAVNDIAGNITAPPPKWQSIVQSKWFIIGFGVVGVSAIGVLLLLRKKTKNS
jgi:hypothetical protein